ncbi:MAG: hypothetical protein GXP41_04275 [Chloroflexi bacterium]|nr:hypothetical protein [Chloroflexota bacterium]
MKRFHLAAVLVALFLTSTMLLPVFAAPANSGSAPQPQPSLMCKVNVKSFEVSGHEVVFELENAGHVDATISDFGIVWPARNGNLHKVTLRGTIWEGNQSPPASHLAPNRGELHARTIQAGEQEELKFRFADSAHEGFYTFGARFAEGCVVSFVSGDPPPSPTMEPSETPEPSMTPDPSETPEPSMTPDPSETPEPSMTPDPSETPGPGPRVEFRGMIHELIPSDADPQHAGVAMVAPLANAPAPMAQVHVTTDTKIEGPDDTILTFADLQVDNHVEVKGVVQVDGSVLAQRIRVQRMGTPEPSETPDPTRTPEPTETPGHGHHRAEVHGWISELTPSDADPDHAGTMIVSLGDVVTSVEVTTDTQIFGKKHDDANVLGAEDMQLTFADLQVGDHVEVKGETQNDGSLLAQLIHVEGGDRHHGNVEFRGPIESLPDTTDFIGTWVVAGISVTVNADTRIEGTPEVGAWAEVKATRQSTGDLLATKIEVRNTHPEPTVEFKGVIEQIEADFWVVRGMTVTITTTTEIIGTPEVGRIAEVHAQVLPDRTLLATRIKVEDPSDHHDRYVEFKGRIQSFSDTEWNVSGVTVLIDSQTVIEGTPEVGKIAEVKGIHQIGAGRTVLARKIEVKEGDGLGPREVELRGTVVSMPDSGFIGEWTISALHGTLTMNVTFTVDSSTIVDESHGIAQVGAFVQVHAQRQPDNTLLATRVKVRR